MAPTMTSENGKCHDTPNINTYGTLSDTRCKWKVKVSEIVPVLSLTKHHAIKAYRGGEV